MKFRLTLVAAMYLIGSTVSAHELPKVAAQADSAARAVVIPMSDVEVFTMNGNSLQGLATLKNGVDTHEVWRSSVAPGASTPVHTHASEEVFVVLTGEGVVRVGDKEMSFKAPCTIVAPAGVEHQVTNTGDVPSDSIVIVTVGSEIRGGDGEVMQLPWRQ